MSLKLWFPLNGDINNYAFSNDNVFTNRTTDVYVNGKLDKGMNFSGSSSTRIASYDFSLSSEGTLCLWVKWNTLPTTSSNDWLIDFASTSSYGNAALAISMYHKKYLTVCLGGKYNASIITEDENGDQIAAGKWYHICVTWTEDICKLYINGYLFHTYTELVNWSITQTTKLSLGANVVDSSTRFKGVLNDIRLYDNVLSPREIKEISNGLLVHYTFDIDRNNPFSNINLVKNGWGGTENWTKTDSASLSTSVPSISGITHAYSNSNTTKDFITLNPSHTYRLSAYIKKNTGSTCYLTLIPYDIDKKQIHNYEQPDGFKSATLTTIKEPLNPGDTVIYLADNTDMSKWVSTSINTRYSCYVALFGYADSTGYIYPDLYYTRRIYSYRGSASGVDVTTNIDTTNKTVTLLSPYSGTIAIPAGTSICLSTAGSGYYYPNTISGTNAADWVLLSRTFVPKNVNYLKAARYVKVLSMNKNQWLAGITLEDLSTDNIIHDCSGYKHNLELFDGNLFYLNANTPRYSSSIEFYNGSLIETMSPSVEVKTVSFWAKWNSIPETEEKSIVFADQKSKIGFGINEEGIICSTNGVSTNIFDSSVILTGMWYHIVIVNTGNTPTSTTRDLYINGIKQTPLSTTNYLSFDLYDLLQIGNREIVRSESSYGFDGSLSDFRMYTTALSENDIQDLYNVGASIDNESNFYTNNIIENSENLLKYEYTIIGTNSSNTSTRGKYTVRNDVPAMAFKATDTYWGSAYQHVMLAGRFKENTQYVFDLWLDTDDVIYNGNNVAAGFTIYYTDNTSTTTLTCTGSQANPKGWQHKFYISTAGKTVSDIIVYYYTSVTFYVRADSFITELSETSINKNAITYTGQVIESIENTGAASIGKAAINAKNFIET